MARNVGRGEKKWLQRDSSTRQAAVPRQRQEELRRVSALFNKTDNILVAKIRFPTL